MEVAGKSIDEGGIALLWWRRSVAYLLLLSIQEIHMALATVGIS